MITEPKVTCWAVSDLAGIDAFGEQLAEGIFTVLPPLPETDDISPADYVAEAAGRACYQSWDRPNQMTANTDDYIAHILQVKHFSVLAHASATFYIEGVSRSLTHELVRHRFLAFSQLSQRYVDGKDMDWVCPPLALDDALSQVILQRAFDRAREDYENLTERLVQQALELNPGASRTLVRKRAREAARAVLPNETETKIVVTGNMRAWRDFLDQRWTEGADLEIQRLAGVILEQLREIAPATFADYGKVPV